MREEPQADACRIDRNPAAGSSGLKRPEPWRYVRLYWNFAASCLIRETSFRANFIVRCLTHIIWLSFQIVFFQVIFRHTPRIGDWDKYPYLFFLGTNLTLNAIVNCLFTYGCSQFSELVRTGSLDFALLKPVDEQFLLTCGRVDWAMIPEVLFSLTVTGYAAAKIEGAFSVTHAILYVVLLTAGLAVLYSLLLIVSACSVWVVRQEELYDLWFYVLQFARYPDEIYRKNPVGSVLRIVLTYVLPILLAINVPARYGAMLLDHWHPVALLGAAAIMALVASRAVFKFALRSYQSASS